MPKAPAAKKPAQSKAGLNGKAKKKPATKEPTRDVQYDQVAVSLKKGDKALTVAQAKKILGWEEEPEGGKWGSDFLLIDENGKKVRCHNNTHNRPFYPGLARTWQNEILQRHWKLNGETLIIGRTGVTISAQHRLIALVLASQEVENHHDKWAEYWQTEPTMECILVVGIDESDETVNTVDTGKPRNLGEVIYRSSYFDGMKDGDRRKCGRITEHAVKMLWHRTGAKMNAFAPIRTHSDSVDFIARHPKLLEAVKHVYEENTSENKLAGVLTLGYASALLYLMAAAKSDPANYRHSDHPSESQLDFSLWEDACTFWTIIAGGAEELKSVRIALGKIIDDDGGSPAERCALIVKAWNAYATDKKVTYAVLELEYSLSEGGVRRLVGCPTVGGIDLGNPSEESDDSDDAEAEETEEPDETEAESEAVDEAVATPAPKKGKGKAKKADKTDYAAEARKIAQGTEIWVIDRDDAIWKGTFKGLREDDLATIVAATGFAGAGKPFPVPLAHIRTTEPVAA